MESRNPEEIMVSNSSLNTLLGNPLFFSQILIRTTQSLKYIQGTKLAFYIHHFWPREEGLYHTQWMVFIKFKNPKKVEKVHILKVSINNSLKQFWMVELAKGSFFNLANLTKNLQKETVGKKKSFNLISLSCMKGRKLNQIRQNHERSGSSGTPNSGFGGPRNEAV